MGLIMKTVIPIKNITEFKNDEELKDFCEHIVSHSERYEKERVFEAKEILNNLKKKPIRDITGKVIKEGDDLIGVINKDNPQEILTVIKEDDELWFTVKNKKDGICYQHRLAFVSTDDMRTFKII